MLRKTGHVLLAVTLSLTAITTASAQDQELGEVNIEPRYGSAPRYESPSSASRSSFREPGPLRFYGGFSLAVGGELKGDTGPGARLYNTRGFQLGADYKIMDFFSIGGETRFLWFSAPVFDSDDRDFLWDIVVKPRGYYTFKDMPLEVYGALPIGLTVPGIGNRFEGDPVNGTVGWNIGLMAGANYFLTENLGVSVEMGWQFRKFGTEIEVGSSTYEAGDAKMNQFVLLCPNFVYAL